MPAKKKSNKGRKNSNKGKRKPSSSKKEVAKKEETKQEEEKKAVVMDTTDDTLQDSKNTDTTKKDTETKEEEKIVDTRKIALDELKTNVHMLAQAVSTKDSLLFMRVVRHINSVRKKMTPGNLSMGLIKYNDSLVGKLADFQAEIATEDEAEAAKQTKLLEAKLVAEKEAAEKEAKADADRLEAEKEKRKGKDPTEEEKKVLNAEAKKRAEEKKKKVDEAAKEAAKQQLRAREDLKKDEEAKQLPEVSVYMQLLLTVFLLDRGKKEQAALCAEELVTLLQSFNRRTLDHLSAKVWHYYSLTKEAMGQLGSIRNQLLLAHRTACLQHNEPAQAALVVSILRNFLAFKLYTQADQFRLNTTFPESRSNNNFSRYLYYVGQINSVQLHYSDAYASLSQAIRKAPQTTALNFRLKATKLMVIVQLLMGDIPERSLFRTPEYKAALQPYFELTQAVRVGNPVEFEKLSVQYKDVWMADGVAALIDRLRNNVIKTGLRKINLSYSRISLKDISAKLSFDSPEDAENVVAKAIHDGVIEAVLDRNNGYLYSKENTDVYSTYEPQGAFHKRIQFCNAIHNEAVKALRFPPNAHKSDAERESDALRDNEKAVDEALAEAEKEDDDEM